MPLNERQQEQYNQICHVRDEANRRSNVAGIVAHAEKEAAQEIPNDSSTSPELRAIHQATIKDTGHRARIEALRNGNDGIKR